MQRYNIFYQIHKGLREMLYQTASRLQQTDFTMASETEAIAEQMNIVLDLFDKHAATEDHFILPAIETYEPSVSSLFAEEHVQDHALSDKLRSVLKGLQVAENDNDKNTWGTVLRPVFIDFVVFNLNHMAKEEEVLNKLLWRYYSDEELQAITGEILAYQPPQTLQLFSSWMLRGLSNNEIKDWLKEVKHTAPDFIFNGLLAEAERVLPQNRWNVIRETITEGALVA
jgi:hemerythrin-like domain-containing protein